MVKTIQPLKILMEAKGKTENKPFWMLKKNEVSNQVDLILYGEISSTTWWGDEVTPKLLTDELKAFDNPEIINVRINSPGGDVFAGQAIYSILKRHSAKIHVYVDGVAASAASLIAMAGDKIIMPANSMLMIHNPYTMTSGDSEQLRKTADFLDKIRESAIVPYQEKSGKSRDDIAAIMDKETWFTAEEAVKEGFADEIENHKISMLVNQDNAVINGVQFKISQLGFLKPNNKINCENNKNRSKSMDLISLCAKFGMNYNILSAQGQSDEQIKDMILLKMNPQADKEDAVKMERQRILEIKNLCTSFQVSSEDETKYMSDSKISVEVVKSNILEKIKLERPPLPAAHQNIKVIAEASDKFKAAASDGILLRAGIRLQKPADGANELRSLSIRDLAIDCLAQNGVGQANRLDNDQLFKMALSSDSNFESILTNSVNKSMSTAYNALVPTYKSWAGVGSNPDFKDATHYQISEAGELKKMTQSGEFKFDEMKDNGVKKSLATFGRSFGFTRQAMINDDLSVLVKVPQAYVRAAGRGINKMVYAMLGNNSVIFDGKTLFHSDHSNLASTPAVISTASISAGRAAMRKQKNQRGKEVLNIQPKYMITPAELEATAAQFLRSLADPSGSNSGVANIYANSMELIVDAELDSHDAKTWYMAASPQDIDTIEVTYLNGNESPILESRVGFDYLGVEWRIYQDVGVTALDYRGLYKNAGV